MKVCFGQQASARTALWPSRPQRLICSSRRKYIPAAVPPKPPFSSKISTSEAFLIPATTASLPKNHTFPAKSHSEATLRSLAGASRSNTDKTARDVTIWFGKTYQSPNHPIKTRVGSGKWIKSPNQHRQNKNNNKLRGRRDRPQRRLVFQLMKFSFCKASLTASSGELQGPV